MEYTNLIAAVPAGESFDSSAVNEGVWLSLAHLDAVENKLADNAAAVNSIITQFDSEALARQQAEASLITANETITARENSIVEKDAEIARLKAGAAGTMKDTSKENDDLGDDTVAESETTKQARLLREIRDGKKVK